MEESEAVMENAYFVCLFKQKTVRMKVLPGTGSLTVFAQPW